MSKPTAGSPSARGDRATRAPAEGRAGPPRYARLHDRVAETVFELDRDGCFVRLLSAGELLTDRPPDQLIGSHFSDVIARDALPFARSMFDALATGRETHLHLELPLVRAGGDICQARVTAVAAPLTDGSRGIRGIARDITDEQRAGAELAALHARHAHVMSASPIVLYELHVDLARQISEPLFVSDNVERILGYAPDEVLRPGWWMDGVHPDDRDHAAPFLTHLLHSGSGVHTYRFRRRNGSWMWVQDNVRITSRHDDGSFDVTGSWTDVTITKGSQIALQESERSYRALFQSLTEHVIVIGLDGRILGVNEAALAAHGYARDELVGRDSIVLADETRLDLDAFMHAFRTAAEGTPTHLFLWGRRRDGDSFPAEISFTPGRYFGQDAVIAVGSDITERHAAQQKLAAAEAHYRRIIETSPSGIFVVDREGIVLELNPAGLRILDRSSEALLGTHFRELLPSEDRSRSLPALVDVLEGRSQSAEFETRIQRPSGEVRHVHVNVTAIHEDGEIRGAHGTARDITDELKQEQQLRRVERLATIGTLIGGVAHELNNPLQAISSFAALLLEDERPESERRDLETIRREAVRASRVVSDLRMLARDSQEAIGRREQVDLNDVVRHVLRTREYNHRTHNIEVRADLTAGLPALWADAGALEQVLINLIVNAEQAMAQQETARLLIVRTRPAGGGIALHVVDSGPGIAHQHLNRIFDPFFTTKGRREGTGLGLSLVHKIIREHGGQIQVESESGRGAAFHIHLPRLATTLPVAERPQSAAPVPSCALRVLVVDDEPALRTVLARYLGRRGHTVEAASDGADALHRIQSAAEPFDVILSDLRMPGLGGDELLDALEMHDPGAQRRIMFLTGEPPDGTMASAIANAEVPIIYKPIELPDLAAQLERHAERIREGQ